VDCREDAVMIAAAEDTAFVMKALREGVMSETMDIEKAVAWLKKAAAKAPVARRKYFILSFADVFVQYCKRDWFEKILYIMNDE
jgi:hypothetical protein